MQKFYDANIETRSVLTFFSPEYLVQMSETAFARALGGLSRSLARSPANCVWSVAGPSTRTEGTGRPRPWNDSSRCSALPKHLRCGSGC